MTSRNKARARAQAAAPSQPPVEQPTTPPGADVTHPGEIIASVNADSEHIPEITHALDARLTR